MYEVPDPGGNVRIAVYNIAEHLVRTLVDEYKKPGYYSSVWDGRDNRGQSVASSMYFVQMIAGSFKGTKKAVFLR